VDIRILENITSGNQPALLLGTALLAVSPNPTTTLVFGVSRLLFLTLFVCVNGTWSGPIYPPQLSGNKVFAHTRLAYNIINPTTIQVVAISYQGVPAIFLYTYDSRNKAWNLAAPANMTFAPDSQMRSFPRVRGTARNPGPPMPLRQGEMDARLWSINPFSDLNFGVDPSHTGETVLMCAGAGPGNAVGVLYRRIWRDNEDWYLIA
jgi:hypothetical protein